MPAFLTTLQRGRHGPSPGAERDALSGLPQWVERLLHVSLPTKLAGANAFLLIAAALSAVAMRRDGINGAPVIVAVGVSFVVAILVNVLLVSLAVRPIRVLETTVDSIWHGDLMRVCHAHVSRIGTLPSRAHVQHPARWVALGSRAHPTAGRGLHHAGDRERAAVSRELHDSVAQSLAALVMQLGALSHDASRAPVELLGERLRGAKALAASTLEEVRLMAHTMHPRVLEDLGLVTAVRSLVRELTERGAYTGEMTVEVIGAEGVEARIPAARHR